MKKLSLVLLILLSFATKGYSQFGTDLILTHDGSASTVCPYTITVSALVYNFSTGAYAMTVPQSYTISALTTTNITLPKPLGFQVVSGQFVFNIAPNGGGCSFGVNYTTTPAPPTVVTSNCSCIGISPTRTSYWQKLSANHFSVYML